MSAGTDALKVAFRDFNVIGVPASGPSDPPKPEIRAAADKLALDIAAAASASAGDGIEEIVAVVQPLVDRAEDAADRADAVAELFNETPGALIRIDRPYSAIMDPNAAGDDGNVRLGSDTYILNDAFGKFSAASKSVVVDLVEIWANEIIPACSVQLGVFTPGTEDLGAVTYDEEVAVVALVPGRNTLTAPDDFTAFEARTDQTLRFYSPTGGLLARLGSAIPIYAFPYLAGDNRTSPADTLIYVNPAGRLALMARAGYKYALDEAAPTWRFYSWRENGGNNAGGGETLVGYEGRNGQNFPIELPITYTGRPATDFQSLRDSSVYFDRKTRTYWLAHSAWSVQNGPTRNTFYIAKSKNGVDFTFVAAIAPDPSLMTIPSIQRGVFPDNTIVNASLFGPMAAWAPEWFVDDDGSVYINIAHHYGQFTDPNETTFPDLTSYLYRSVHPEHRKFELVGPLTGEFIPRKGGTVDRTTCFDVSTIKLNGSYHIVGATRTVPQRIFRAWGPTPVGPFDQGEYPFLPEDVVGDGIEGPMQVLTDDGAHRVYFDNYNGPGFQFAESTDFFATRQTYPISLPNGLKPRHGDVIRIGGPNA
jgi:hypothetical protein